MVYTESVSEPAPESISESASQSQAGREAGSEAQAGREAESCAFDGEKEKGDDGEQEEEGEKVIIIVMGVSGTGKSTLSHALASALRFAHIEGDDLHPPANVAKMSAGVPLGDADREPWLGRVRGEGVRVLVAGDTGEEGEGEDKGEGKRMGCKGVVISCSALKAYYRDILRGQRAASSPSPSTTTTPTHAHIQTYFVYISGSPALLLERMEKRPGHFMKAPMLASQLSTLEDPRGEQGVVAVDLGWGTREQVREAVRGLRAVAVAGREGKGGREGGEAGGFVRFLEGVERELGVGVGAGEV